MVPEIKFTKTEMLAKAYRFVATHRETDTPHSVEFERLGLLFKFIENLTLYAMERDSKQCDRVDL